MVVPKYVIGDPLTWVGGGLQKASNLGVGIARMLSLAISICIGFGPATTCLSPYPHFRSQYHRSAPTLKNTGGPMQTHPQFTL